MIGEGRRPAMKFYLSSSDRGFSLLELLVVLVIVAMLTMASIPYGSRFYESMQYRSVIRETLSLLASARYTAIVTGVSQDVVFDLKAKKVSLKDNFVVFPESLDISGKTARELNRDGLGVIRFYPQGDSSGGEIDIIGKVRGVRLSVDWLLGRVSQSLLDVD